MGCKASSPLDEAASPIKRISASSPSDDVKRSPSADGPRRNMSGMSRTSTASVVSQEQSKKHHKRLMRLLELDEATKIPFILVELRGCGDGDGYVEVCGKDEYGVYTALSHFLESEFRCKKLDHGSLSEDTEIPFCDALFRWKQYRATGDEGMSNMGLATMQLVDFMTNTLCWTLGVINGGNVGSHGEIREQQIIFKAPHPMNMVAGHIMIELRSVGFIEVCGTDREDMDKLHYHFMEKFNATPVSGHEKFCNRFYQCGANVFKERGSSGENNMGMMTTQVCDTVINLLHGWSLVTMNGGNYGEAGQHREQQLVFRADQHPLREAPHLMVELRGAGYIEVCGQDADGIYDKLNNWFCNDWKCKEVKSMAQESFCDKKYKWEPKDMMVATAEVTQFFHNEGWQMQVCSQGTVKVKKGKEDVREQQLLFRPGASGHGVVEPHLFFELYTGEGDEELYAKGATQVLANQFIRVKQVGDCDFAMRELDKFVHDYLDGERESTDKDGVTKYTVDCFLSRGLTDNNLGGWTMRLCDFMVDRLGWSFVVCNVCNLGPCGQFREQQLVFRFDGERREIPAVRDNNSCLDWTQFPGVEMPKYWNVHDVLSLKKAQHTVCCSKEEVAGFQSMFDHTFRRILTRDRVYEFQLGHNEEMPYRLEVVHAFRSEHAELYRRFYERRKNYKLGEQCRAKTSDAPGVDVLTDRLEPGDALLAHGTNPSSAMAILKNGFVLNHAGKATGTMFGFGIYLAEAVSKSDEYARDDNGGTYPGLMALLICRAFVGNPYVVHDAGDYCSQAKAGGYDCVLGDRETKVGTYREFIFWDETQVYPEYAVIYRRQYKKEEVPSLMRQKTFGTTGKNWQVQVDKGWANTAPDVSKRLNEAQDQGKTTMEMMIVDTMYTFDINKMTQQNQSTEKVRPIRPPMRR